MKDQLNQCQKCSKTFSRFDMVQNLLRTWRKYVTPLPSVNKETTWPSTHQLDIATYTYSYHMKHRCAEKSLSSHPIWVDAQIRSMLKQMRFDEHRYRHTKSCWKRGHVCRFGPLPWPPNLEASWIFEDKRLPGQTDHSIVWQSLHPSKKPIMLPPWMNLTKRSPGCQYINTHNDPIGDVLNYNTNGQVGDGCQCFYCTLYTSKSTQEEDSERQKRINDASIILVIKQEKAVVLGEDTDKSTDDNAFVDRLCTMLCGMNGATARDIVSPAIARLLTKLDRTLFQYSYNFMNLLIGQLEVTLDGQPIDARMRTNKSKIGVKNFGQIHHLMIIFMSQMSQIFFHCTSMLRSTKKPKIFTQIDLKGASVNRSDSGNSNNASYHEQHMERLFLNLSILFATRTSFLQVVELNQDMLATCKIFPE